MALRTLRLAVVGACLAAELAGFGATSLPATGHQQARDAASQRVVAAVAAARNHRPIPSTLHPSVNRVGDDLADVGRCDYQTPTRRLCRRGDARSQRVLVALGDSHARAWIPALERIAHRAHYATYYLVKPGCSAAAVVPARGRLFRQSCAEFRQWAFAQIRRLRADVVVMAGILPPALMDSGSRVSKPAAVARLVKQGFVTSVRAIQGRVGKTFITQDNPGMRERPGDCLSAPGNDLGDCAAPPQKRANLMSWAQQHAAQDSSATFIRTRQWFCADSLCPAVVGSTITHRDLDHITTVYARELSRPLQRAMRLHRP